MDYNAEHVLVLEFGVSKSMIVHVELETGMELLVLSAQQITIGMAEHVFPVHREEFGTLWILFVNAQNKLSGMELLVLKPVRVERSLKTVFVNVQLANFNKTENALTCQHAK